MAGCKTLSILLLIVVIALASGSPAFATDNIVIIPASACPGAQVILGADVATSIDGCLTHPVISSNPAGLIMEDCGEECECGVSCGPGDIEFSCGIRISEPACAGPYTVTVTAYDAQGTIVGSADIQFTVGTEACPNVPPCSTAAVGGCVQPVNTFTLLSPWLAIVGLVGCIGTVAVIAKKRQP